MTFIQYITQLCLDPKCFSFKPTLHPPTHPHFATSSPQRIPWALNLSTIKTALLRPTKWHILILNFMGEGEVHITHGTFSFSIYIHRFIYCIYRFDYLGGGGGLINKTKRQARQVLGATVNDRTFFNWCQCKNVWSLTAAPKQYVTGIYIYLLVCYNLPNTYL